MKRSNSVRMKLMLFVIVAGTVLGGGRAKADFTFGEPINLGSVVNTSAGEEFDCFSSDGLEMYMASNRPGGYGSWDIWVTTRQTIDDNWGTPVNLGPVVNAEGYEFVAYTSYDDLELYFTSNRSGGFGSLDIWVTRRTTKDDEWGTPENLGPLVNSSGKDGTPWISPDGLELYFYSENRAGGYGRFDIWTSRRTSKDDPWGEPVNLGMPVNSPAIETSPLILSGGLLLFFGEEIISPFRPGGFGGSDLWLTRRTNISDPWGTPVNLGPIVNSPSHDCHPRISPDGSMLYFCSERPGGFGGTYGDIYQASIIPIMDLNGDGIVDSVDMCKILDHWGEDYPLCDVGPTPFGDGTIDAEDLKVLAEHLFENVNDPTLIAHWPLDETEGDTAYNSVSICDGILISDPIWKPDGGMVAGALQLDGMDDYVSTDFVLNPADGKFSVVAWIKGGAPGQVVLSQTGVSNWLLADPSEGFLITELKTPSRGGKALLSQTNITDGNWHRIAFVWDGSYRTLYVDGVVVAEDIQDDLDISSNGLYFGTGKNMESGTFFSGLIDDIRIYKRVVIP